MFGDWLSSVLNTTVAFVHTFPLAVPGTTCILELNYREMVTAMQDPGAGIKLVELGLKRGKGVTKYFTGRPLRLCPILYLLY